jgi:hypothetical protein
MCTNTPTTCVPFSSIRVCINLFNFIIHKKKINTDLAHQKLLNLEKELNAVCSSKLGLKTYPCDCGRTLKSYPRKLRNEARTLYKKKCNAYDIYHSLKLDYITAIKKSIKIMVHIIEEKTLQKTLELIEKEDMTKAYALEIVLLIKKQNLNGEEVRKFNWHNQRLKLNYKNELDVLKKEKENDVIWNILRNEISEAREAYTVVEEEMYQLLVKVFIY